MVPSGEPNKEGRDAQEVRTCSLTIKMRKLLAAIGKPASVTRLEQTSDYRPMVGMSQSQHIQVHRSPAIKTRRVGAAGKAGLPAGSFPP